MSPFHIWLIVGVAVLKDMHTNGGHKQLLFYIFLSHLIFITYSCVYYSYSKTLSINNVLEHTVDLEKKKRDLVCKSIPYGAKISGENS